MKHSSKEVTDRYFANQKKVALVKAIAFFVIGSALVLWLGSCNTPKSAIGSATAGIVHANPIDLPEEIEAIVEDSLHAVPLYGWYDKKTGIRHIEFRNYKP